MDNDFEAFYQAEQEREARVHTEAALQRAVSVHGLSPVEAVRRTSGVVALWSSFDDNGDGEIGFLEFRDLARVFHNEAGEEYTEEEARVVYDRMDRDGDGGIDQREFMDFIYRKTKRLGPKQYDSLLAKMNAQLHPHRDTCHPQHPKNLLRQAKQRAALAQQAEGLSLEETTRGGTLFRCIDIDHSGSVDLDELGGLVSRHDREAMMAVLDDDGDRVVSLQEWLGYLGGAKAEMNTGVSHGTDLDDLTADNFSAFLAYIEGNALLELEAAGKAKPAEEEERGGGKSTGSSSNGSFVMVPEPAEEEEQQEAAASKKSKKKNRKERAKE